VIDSHGLRGGLNYYVVVKQSITQALRKYGVHWLSSTERLSHEREDRENIRNLKKNQPFNEALGKEELRTKFGLTTLV
jgi:hypothetical protein